uniref:Uncharacterized protein n=1 Tax=Anguilla anguilla TaxID=7936 RepID=A0A0E9VDA4_ANGAN
MCRSPSRRMHSFNKEILQGDTQCAVLS